MNKSWSARVCEDTWDIQLSRSMGNVFTYIPELLESRSTIVPRLSNTTMIDMVIMPTSYEHAHHTHEK